MFALASSAFALIYNPSTGNSYALVDSGQSGAWVNAEANAVALGGHLVTINDALEEAWLRETFGRDIRLWIGFNDAAAEGAWVWSSGQTPGYSNWNEGEPNNSTEPEYGEDYAVLNWNYDTGAWNDWDHMRGDYQHIQGIAEIPGGDGVPDGGATAGLLGLGFLALAGLKRARKV